MADAQPQPEPKPEPKPEPTADHVYDVCAPCGDGEFLCRNCGRVVWDPTDENNGKCDERLVRQVDKRLATLTDDQIAFETTIYNDPKDAIARVVYADWLDEHDDPKFARAIRVVPDWFMTGRLQGEKSFTDPKTHPQEVADREVNVLRRYLPTDLRTRCMMWLILMDMFPSYDNTDFHVMFKTTQILEGMMLRILALAENE